MRLFKFFLPLFWVIVNLSQANDSSFMAGQTDIVKELNEILDKEKSNRGSFIKSIIADLKQCSNQKLLFLNYLTIKSAYWWDTQPRNRIYDQTDDVEIQKYKDFLIDRKFRSSIYDREGPNRNMPLASLIFKFSGSKISYNQLINSWKSASEKIKFYEQKDIGFPKGTINNILDYGYPFEAKLDTYPSVYQIMRAAKWLKYQKQQQTSSIEQCPLTLQEIEKKSPPEIIIENLDNLFKKSFYQKFSKQNHPLSQIIQDHLLKLYHQAKEKYFLLDSWGIDLDDDKTTYNRTLLFYKVVNNIEKLIKYMSVFDIDINKGICEVKDLNVNNIRNDAYYLYTQFYEIINDLLFALMYTENLYSRADFNKILSRTYVNRIPVLQELHATNHITIQSFPMRSGMDAFVNASMSIGHMPQSISIAPKVSGLENSVYYEIDRLLEGRPLKPRNKTYIFLNQAITSDEVKLIKDNFITEYIKSIKIDMKPAHEQDKTKENNKFLEDFTKNFTDHPFNANDYLFNARGIWEYSYNEMSPEIAMNDDVVEMRAKSDVVIKILNSIKKTDAYDYLFEVKDYNGKHFLIVPNTINNDLFKKVQKKYPFLEYMLSIDDHPSFVAGMTPDTLDQSNDPNYVDQLFNKIKTILMVKKHQNSSDLPFIILWDTTLEINQGPCYALIEKFREEIKAGKVIFILFKSLQKYASLGVGKTKAGVTTIIGQNDACEPYSQKLNEYARDVWSHHASEFMLMLFYYDRFKDKNKLQTVEGLQDNEAFYYEAVSNHAKRINERNHHFYSISGGCLFLKYGPSNLRYADTFGFAIPTNTIINIGNIGELIRYSVGLNPKGLQ